MLNWLVNIVMWDPFDVKSTPFDPNDIVPGTHKPSIILIDMVILEMLKNISKVVTRSNEYKARPFEYVGKSFKVNWIWKWGCEENASKGRFDKGYLQSYALIFDSVAYDLSIDEEKRFINGLKKVMALALESTKSKAEFERQQKATEYIDKFFKVPPSLPVK